jgi:hypothetical protein
VKPEARKGIEGHWRANSGNSALRSFSCVLVLIIEMQAAEPLVGQLDRWDPAAAMSRSGGL